MIALALFLVLYGNAASLLGGGSALPVGSATGAGAGLLLAIVLLAWARVQGLGPGELGLLPRRALQRFGIGALAAVIVVAPALLVLRFPPLIGSPITYAPASTVAQSDLLLRVALFMPLDTIIPEEFAFRGVLLAALRRRYGAAPAIVASAVTFTLWHVVIVLATVGQTSLASSPLWSTVATLGAFLVLFAGGVALALLRILTGHLATPIGAHWGFNAGILLGLRWVQAALA